MAVDPAQASVVEGMRYRELQLKRRARATDAIRYRQRRFRAVLLGVAGAVAAAVAAVAVFVVLNSTLDRVGWWPVALALVLLCIFIGVRIGQWVLGTRAGTNLLGMRERQLRRRYAEDINAARRWGQFFYNGEDISAYVPQILYFLESDPRFTTIDEALAFAKEHRRANALLVEQANKAFEQAANVTSLLVISSVDDAGRPSSRIMRFVKTEEPGVWYVSSSPYGPKVAEFDRGAVALVTLPTPGGGNITSNRVIIRRAPFMLDAVADLFEAQVPGYLDGVSAEDQRLEIVYELRLVSARVDTWFAHDVVEFEDADRS